MSHRAAELVAVLYRAGGQLETKDLAAKLHVGERSVRRYISAANDELAGIASIEHDHGRGYILSISDRQEFSSYLKDAEAAAARSGTRAERVSYLINDLLSRSDWVTLDTLSDILFVSRRTISSDLRDVAHSLSRFNLSLESKPYRGIRVVGAEMDKRLCLANTAFQEVLDAQGVDACGVTVENIASCIEDALDAHGVTMSSTGYHNLFVHIAVAIVRIKANQYVPMESESLESIRHVPSFSVAQEIVASLERRFDMTFPVEEVAYIALHLAGKQVSFDGGTDVDSQPIISDEIWSIVAEMVEAVWQAYRFDLRNDLELRMNLARHVAPLAVRMQYHMRVDNPLMEDIQARFPLAWSMAVDASRVLERAFDSSLDNAEIGYIALAFALAIERSSERPYKKRILVVCASGAGSARLLEYRCHQEFGAYLESVQACDVSMVGNVDFSRIDYVFTTVPLPIEVPVPVREVGVFLDSADVKGIIELFKKPSGGGLLRYFPRELFFPHMTQSDRASVLDVMIEKSITFFDLSPDFRDLVLERERIAPTSFGNLVALPHPVRAIGGDPFVAVGLLDKPIAWNGHEVQVVFLISFSGDANADPDEFNSGIAALLTDRSAIERLLDERSYETLHRLLGQNSSS